ncbi:MAG: hypothetical protein CVV53_06780 [Spirochaetae bacterium HGW-Spirochaetae-9]|nr:MAG: hypothetical protein CVV53_06780 [Spirochaetae bacterium HGW-Spirochaetae-9]
MKNLTLRGCEDDLALALKKTSKQRGVSINRLILETLREKLLDTGRARRRHDDMDHLAGTWSEEEAASFERRTAEFEEIDEALWVAAKPASR